MYKNGNFTVISLKVWIILEMEAKSFLTID
jgi:hypothetical protein